MNYSGMTEEQLDACAELLAHLSGTLTSVCSIRDLGEGHMLALDFAYSKAKDVVVQELAALVAASKLR